MVVKGEMSILNGIDESGGYIKIVKLGRIYKFQG